MQHPETGVGAHSAHCWGLARCAPRRADASSTCESLYASLRSMPRLSLLCSVTVTPLARRYSASSCDLRLWYAGVRVQGGARQRA